MMIYINSCALGLKPTNLSSSCNSTIAFTATKSPTIDSCNIFQEKSLHLCDSSIDDSSNFCDLKFKNSINFAMTANKLNSTSIERFQCILSRRQRSEKRPIPDEQKDAKYFERRKRNNEAAKKSRDARKIREDRVSNYKKKIFFSVRCFSLTRNKKSYLILMVRWTVLKLKL